jgi:anti-anti-sigma factor
MKTDITKKDNTTIFALHGRLDSTTAPDFEKQLQDYIITPASHLIFDFLNLDYISSAGLRLVLNTAKAYRQCPYKFITCRMQDHVHEVFEIAGFDSFITIRQSIDDSFSLLKE